MGGRRGGGGQRGRGGFPEGFSMGGGGQGPQGFTFRFGWKNSFTDFYNK